MNFMHIFPHFLCMLPDFEKHFYRGNLCICRESHLCLMFLINFVHNYPFLLHFSALQSKFTMRGKGWSESTRNQLASSWVLKLRFSTVAPNYQVKVTMTALINAWPKNGSIIIGHSEAIVSFKHGNNDELEGENFEGCGSVCGFASAKFATPILPLNLNWFS